MTDKKDEEQQASAQSAAPTAGAAAEEEPSKLSRLTRRNDETEKLKAENARLAEESAKYLDMARRLQADFDNYRKRTQKENDDYRKYATQTLVTDLLNVADDLERALASAKADDPLTVGVRAVRGNLMKVLEGEGLKEIPTDGRFDPNMHEAMCLTDGAEDGRIAEVYQKGYTMNGRVIRYAKVRVTRKQAAPAPEPAPAAPVQPGPAQQQSEQKEQQSAQTDKKE